MAGWLARVAADVLLHALRLAVPGDPRWRGAVCVVLRLGTHPRRPYRAIWVALRGRVGAYRAARLRCLCPRLPEPVRHRSTISRKLRRVRDDSLSRMAAHRRRR